MHAHMIGCGLDEDYLAEFLKDKRNLLSAEIRAIEYAHTMLEFQDSPSEVLNQVKKMLNVKNGSKRK